MSHSAVHVVIVSSEALHQKEKCRSKHNGSKRKENSGFRTISGLANVAGNGDPDEVGEPFGPLNESPAPSELSDSDSLEGVDLRRISTNMFNGDQEA